MIKNNKKEKSETQTEYIAIPIFLLLILVLLLFIILSHNAANNVRDEKCIMLGFKSYDVVTQNCVYYQKPAEYTSCQMPYQNNMTRKEWCVSKEEGYIIK
jgi:hypothetical protein